MEAETTAAQYGIYGPAASSGVWPLDGPFTTFERTEANVDAYCTFLAVKRTAAGLRMYRDKPTWEERGNFDAAFRAMELAVKSPAMLYACHEITAEERCIMTCISQQNDIQAMEALL